MSYQYDDEARHEAAEHAVTRGEASRLRDLSRRKSSALGALGVRGHCVRFSAAAWGDAVQFLPAAARDRERICRGDVLDIGAQVVAGERSAADLLAASFIWGMGMTGYGPRRHRDICDAAGAQLEDALQQALTAAGASIINPDPVAGYAQFYGGHDYSDRVAPGTRPWSRLRGYGPAFFTKFLYFSIPGALILDARMARAVSRLSGLSRLVDAQDRALAWTPYRYCVYLHWMNQTAQAVEVTPDLLETTLFEPPPDPPDEHEAAD